jgi:hypothetical protein
MRKAALLLLLASGLWALPDEKGVVKSEEFNFEIRTPEDSVDWEVKEIDQEKDPTRKAHFRTEFADSDPPTYADVVVSVMPMAAENLRLGLDKIARKWEEAMEGFLDHKRDRTTKAGKLGGQDSWVVDVKGDFGSGIHQRTWLVAKMGKFMYVIHVDRNFKAIGDEVLEEEIQAILGSFKFLRIEKLEKHKDAKKEDAPGEAGPGSKLVKKKVDPELLKKEKFNEPFWRFKMVKPEGLVKLKVDEQDAKQDIKYLFRHDKDNSRLQIRIYAQTEKAKKWTVDQLLDYKIEYFQKEVKVAKDPKIDKKYKFPLAKKAIRIELVGRSTTTIRRIWILAQCKNDRQYQIEIYLTGANGPQVWDKTIKAFLKGFKPFKR